METAVAPLTLLATMLGGWEIICILGVVLILSGARKLPAWTDRVEEGDPLAEKKSGLVYEALTTDNRTVEFVYPRRTPPSPLHAMVLFLAQGCGVGNIPFAPGTLGSLVGLVWFALLVQAGNYWFYLAGALAGIGLSVWVCGAAGRILKQTDPPSVVLDKITALPICFLPWVTHLWLGGLTFPSVESFFTGRSWLGTAAIFAMFRLFDIVKPWPIRQTQHLSGGWGVALDDVVAAVYVAGLTLFYGAW